jgi:putative DNA primase/helicase
LTQLGNAQRLVQRHGGELRYCHKWKKWLIWNGKQWQIDENGEIERRAKDTVQEIYREGLSARDEDLRNRLFGHARRSERRSEIEAMIALAQSHEGIAVLPDQLDSTPWALNCLNGILDLKTGELYSHDRENLITKITPVSFIKDAECPTWLQFLDRIMAGDEALIHYIQRVIGYALTGSVNEKAMFVLYGGGDNGKTTLLETVRALLGDYAGIVEIDALMQNGHDDVRDRAVAELVGKRFVTSSEAQEGAKLNEAKVKHLTGMGRLQGRHIYGSPFQFDPQFKLFIDANHKPVIRGTDNAIWNRIHLIPFEISIPKAEQDRNLGKKLRVELPGILAWAVQGCLAWQKEGLGAPTAVTDASTQYRSEMDVVAQFIADECVVEPGTSVPAGDLYKAYKSWSKERGDEPFSETKFGSRVTQLGYEGARANGARIRRGLNLIVQPALKLIPTSPAKMPIFNEAA